MGTLTKLKQVLKAGYVVELREGTCLAYQDNPSGLMEAKGRMGTRIGGFEYQIDQAWHLVFGYPEDDEPSQKYLDMIVKEGRWKE